jgi:hypothetical protein
MVCQAACSGRTTVTVCNRSWRLPRACSDTTRRTPKGAWPVPPQSTLAGFGSPAAGDSRGAQTPHQAHTAVRVTGLKTECHGSQQHTELALGTPASDFSGWTLRQCVRGPARKVRWGCSGLGAEHRVGAGWSPITVAAQMDARGGGAALRERPGIQRLAARRVSAMEATSIALRSLQPESPHFRRGARTASGFRRLMLFGRSRGGGLC